MTNTDAYLQLGVTMVVAILGLYTLALGLRFRQANRMIGTLEMLKDEE